jgi:hypothetical protein
MSIYDQDPDTGLPREPVRMDPLPPEPQPLQKWTTEELQRDFEVLGFLAPYVGVIRKSDRAEGTLEFTHSPRVYFGWRPA